MAAVVSQAANYGDIQYRRPRPVVKRAYALRPSPRPPASKTITADSSDDEDLAQIPKLSAEAQAILRGDDSQGGSPKAYSHSQEHSAQDNQTQDRDLGNGRVQQLRRSSASPETSDGSPASRVVRVPSAPRPNVLKSMARDGSFMYKTVEKLEDRPYRVVSDAKTPATRLRKVRVSGSRSVSHSPPESQSHPHSTARSVKRFGAGLGAVPRRGMIRRQSDEEDARDRDEKSPSPEIQQGRRANAELEDLPGDLDVVSRSPPFVRSKTPPAASSSKSSSAKLKPIFQIASLPPLPAAHDQENELEPTFKNIQSSSSMLGEMPKTSLAPIAQPNERPPQASVSPQRQPLAPRSQNTPHRPAPAPPPKMSLIEVATSNAGSSRRTKNVAVTINGRQYKKLDCVGRGGSSRVYRIMAENYTIFALKRVNLEDADMASIAGYKGEIDLLRKLENVDRVIRLYDFEVKEDKQTLDVMMELGESDFNKMLNEQIKSEGAKLDISFTRYYWSQMLECVQAVHDHGIVHSDLKPANFLLVKGQLKLIDFGIANAIQDNTVNVHRENQIGTPNYMSPESLVCHTPAVGAATGTKLLKLGKPSDVWSLGCILYQMTYGQPPFAHIVKQFERIVSIPNPKVEIAFPSTGVGGAVVPFGLIKTLKRCLQRDQTRRPTIQELLSDTDPFLNPVAISPDMLGRMISNVIEHCRKRVQGGRPLPTDEEMRAWPMAFYDKLRQAQEDGSAW